MKIRDLSIEEFESLCYSAVRKAVNQKFLFGIKELSDYLHCSYSKVSKMSSNGTLDKAKKYIGGQIVFDVDIINNIFKLE